MQVLKFTKVFLFFIAAVSFHTSADAKSKSSKLEKSFFEHYSVKNLVKFKSAEAKRMRASLEEGGVMIEYRYSQKKISGDKHGLKGLKALVMQKISDNFVKQPLAHFLPSEKVGKRICFLEGHNGYFRSRVDVHNKKRPESLVMMTDRFHQRILSKDLEKHRIKDSKISPNDAAQILVSKNFVGSVEALCEE